MDLFFFFFFFSLFSLCTKHKTQQLEETVERMLSEGDLYGDGQISLEELKEVMRTPGPGFSRQESASSMGSLPGDEYRRLSSHNSDFGTNLDNIDEEEKEKVSISSNDVVVLNKKETRK